MNYAHGAEKICGIVAPLSSIRVESGGVSGADGGGMGDAGIGEFPDLVELGRIAKSWGFGLIQILPVNDTGEQTSPYSALSAFALHPVYLRLRDLPEWRDQPRPANGAGNAATETGHAATGAGRLVAFEEVYRTKLDLLRALWDTGADRACAAELEAWCAGHDWVQSYACFIELKRRNGGAPWWQWAARLDPDPDFIDAFWNGAESARDCRFWAWIQMRAHGQFQAAALALAGMGIDLMGDIPILMNTDSADLWQRRALFRTDRVAGAPPDMYSPSGQNWGFPLYRWDAIAADGYSFWKRRLAAADLFYSAYRIDHVLGFFRIWALSEREEDGFLGSYLPEVPLARPDLAALGLSAERIRWISRPHVPGTLLRQASAECGLDLEFPLFARIGDEDLYLFKDEIQGSRDIRAALERAVSSRAASGCAASADVYAGEATRRAIGLAMERATAWWKNRTLFEYAPGSFTPSWNFRQTTAWQTLSDHERSALESLIALRQGESQRLWERAGRRILSELVRAVPMQACAEDLGAVPACVPKVLGELGIPGLRVLRWTRDYGSPGAPYLPLSHYPEASVACPSVHDSSSLRQWWREEAERDQVWALARDARAAATPPAMPGDDLDPASAAWLLAAMARAPSRIFAVPIQDLLAMSGALRDSDDRAERINVPGIGGGANWRYRVPADCAAILADEELAARARALAAARGAAANRG